MKKIFSLILALSLVCSIGAISVSAAEASFFVAPNGSDSANGSASAPFATLNKAVEAAKANGGNAIISVAAGEYKLTETIELGANDSNITIVGNGDVTFSGGTEIPYSAFKKVTDKAVLDRIVSDSAKKNLVAADLKALGIDDFGKIRVQGFMGPEDDSGYDPKVTFMAGEERGFAPALTYNDKYLTMSQYPNGDEYCYTDKIILDGSAEDNKLQYTISDPRWKNWTSAKDMWANGYYRNDWADTLAPAVLSEDGVIESYAQNSAVPERRVKFFNLLEETDEPGEYYVDREKGILYMIAPKDFKAGESLTYSGYSKKIFQLNGTKNLKLYNIRFEGTCDTAIYADKTDGLYINDCEFTAIGDIVIFLNKCYNTTVENSYLHDLGSTGIYVNECGDRQNLVSGNTKIVNCHFERYSNYRHTYTPGIHMYRDVGTLVSHCEINDAPHFAIRYDSNDAIIEYCDFYRVCTDSADSGAVYSGRYYNTWGNEIRYNYFHDMQMINTTTGMQMQAVYLDDLSSQTKVFGNVFYKCDSVALYGGGRNNTFENNLMIDNTKNFVMDARGITWGKGATNAAMNNADSVDWHTDVWAKKYPELVKLDRNDPDLGLPANNVIKNNVLFNTPAMSLHELVYENSTVENNIEINDRKAFTDYRNQIFSINEDGIIKKQIPEFQQIPFEKMGRYEYTVELPKADESAAPAPDKTEDEDDGSIKVLLKGEKIKFDVQPTIINNRTMVPLRAIFEALGATVEWDDKTKTVTAVKDDVTITMQIGNPVMTKNGAESTLDSAPTILNNRTLVPVRAIAESFGNTVGWVAETKTVTID